MPNLGYLRSRARENAWVRDCRKRGALLATRTPGSKGWHKADGIALFPDHVEVVQVKTERAKGPKKGGAKISMEEALALLKLEGGCSYSVKVFVLYFRGRFRRVTPVTPSLLQGLSIDR